MLAIVWLISQKSRCNALRCASYGPNIDGFFGSLARVLEQHYGITGLPMKYIRSFRIDYLPIIISLCYRQMHHSD